MLIFNADDFAMSSDCSRGIERAHLEGVVNSTSISMVNGLVELERLVRLPDLQTGLHVNLTEGKAAADDLVLPSAIAQLSGQAQLDPYREICAQLTRYREVMKAEPRHLDSHQYFTYLHPSAWQAFLRVAIDNDLPIRSPRPFLDQARLSKFVRRVEAMRGLTLPFSVGKRADELNRLWLTHPARCRSQEVVVDLDFTPNELAWLTRAQHQDLEIVCHPRLSGPELEPLIQLRSFISQRCTTQAEAEG